MKRSQPPATKATSQLVPVWTLGVLVASSLAVVAAVRLTGNGPDGYAAAAMALNDTDVPPRESRDLKFVDLDDRSVEVVDAGTNVSVARVPAGSDGFLRATLRGLARERLRQGGSSDQPFRLSVWDDGRVRLQDISTGRIIALEAFGPTNRQAFENLVIAHRSKP